MFEHLERIGLANLYDQDSPVSLGNNAKVSSPGWEKLQGTTEKGIPGRCFVAMSFDETLNDAYNFAIEPALKSCGLEARRTDKIPTIVTSVKKSSLNSGMLSSW